MRQAILFFWMVLVTRTTLTYKLTLEQRLETTLLQQTGKELEEEFTQPLTVVDTLEGESQFHDRWQWLLRDVLMLFVGFVSCKTILTLGQSVLNLTPTRKKVFMPEAKHGHIDAWGCTPLHRLAQDNSYLQVGELLKHGSDPDARDAWDETPLHMAARSGEIEAARVLLAFGASIDAANFDDKTPLVVAAEANHQTVCEFLLDRGATAGGLDDQKLPSLLNLLTLQRMTIDQAFESQPAWNQAGETASRQHMSEGMQVSSESATSGFGDDDGNLVFSPRSSNLSIGADRHTRGKAENWRHVSVRMAKVFEALLEECSEVESKPEMPPASHALSVEEADNVRHEFENRRHLGERMWKVFGDLASEVSEADEDDPMRNKNDLTTSFSLPSLLGSKTTCKPKVMDL